MEENAKKVYWLMPYASEIKVYPSYSENQTESKVVSVKAKEFLLLKTNEKVEGEIVVTTELGYLKFIVKESSAKQQQMEKIFNASKSFCNKLLSRVSNTLGDKTFDFSKLEDIKLFMDNLVEAKMIIGVTGQEGKKGALKRVVPVTPFNPSKPKPITPAVQTALMESVNLGVEFFILYENLIQKLGLIKDDEVRIEQEEIIENIL